MDTIKPPAVIVDTLNSKTRITVTPRSWLKDAKKIGVALGPRIPSGMVDLGLLLGLQQHGIEVNMISGTSMGAVIGALYASGVSPEDIRDMAVELFAANCVAERLRKDRKYTGLALGTGEKLMEYLIQVAGWDPDFYELKTPFYVVASDKQAQQSVVLRYGKVFDAVRASLAIPLVLDEKRQGGMRLADGAIFKSLDTDILYTEGADFVFAIHAKVIRSITRRSLPLLARLEPYFLRLLGWQVDPEVFFSKPQCDVLLRPRVPKTLTRNGTHIRELVDLGTKIAYEAIDGLKSEQRKTHQKGETVSLAANPEKVRVAERLGQETRHYLQELERRTANRPDAAVVKEFPHFAEKFQGFVDAVSVAYPSIKEANHVLKSHLGVLAGHVDESPFMSRALRKPRGYAGDYQLMNYIYDNKVLESPTNMGKFLNYCILACPGANAVRNRAKIIQGLIQQRLYTQGGELAVASHRQWSGPGSRRNHDAGRRKRNRRPRPLDITRSG